MEQSEQFVKLVKAAKYAQEMHDDLLAMLRKLRALQPESFESFESAIKFAEKKKELDKYNDARQVVLDYHHDMERKSVRDLYDFIEGMSESLVGTWIKADIPDIIWVRVRSVAFQPYVDFLKDDQFENKKN